MCVTILKAIAFLLFNLFLSNILLYRSCFVSFSNFFISIRLLYVHLHSSPYLFRRQKWFPTSTYSAVFHLRKSLSFGRTSTPCRVCAARRSCADAAWARRAVGKCEQRRMEWKMNRDGEMDVCWSEFDGISVILIWFIQQSMKLL